MVICLRGLLSIIHFLTTPQNFFSCGHISFLDRLYYSKLQEFWHYLEDFLQIIHAECFEYMMEFHTIYKFAGVPQQFSPGHGPDSLFLLKSYIATTEEKLLLILLLLHPIFLSAVCSCYLHLSLYLLDWLQKQELFQAFSFQLGPFFCCTDSPFRGAAFCYCSPGWTFELKWCIILWKDIILVQCFKTALAGGKGGKGCKPI